MTYAVWIAPGYPWEDEPAEGVFHRTQARALARLGVAVTVVCARPWAPWPLSRLREQWRHYAQAPAVAVDAGVNVVRPRFPNVPGQPSWALPDRFVAQAAWRARGDWRGARLIHGHHAVSGLAAWRLARRADVPFMLTFHGSDMNTWPDVRPERLPDLRAAVRDASAVIAVSAALADRVRAVTGVAAIPMPIGSDHGSLAASALPRGQARELLGIPEDRVVVLFVGRLDRAKGVRELASAILTLGDPFLGVFVGDGPEAGFGSGDPPHSGLQYRGARPHEEIAQYLSAADVFVLPSSREGLPTVLVEAGSLRVPVIASSVGGIPELLGQDRGTILPRVSTEDIAAALTAFLANRDRAEAAAQRLHEHVLESYDVHRNAVRLLECYRFVAAGSRMTGEQGASAW